MKPTVISIPIFLLISVFLISATVGPSGKKNFKPPKSFAYVPSGILKTDTKEVSVNGFFISKYEVSNLEYNVFLEDLKIKGETEKYEAAKRKRELWSTIGSFKESGKKSPFVDAYADHPAYHNYPVVNISKEGAKLYCEWLSEKLTFESKHWNIFLRLPVEEEWTMAARGGNDSQVYGWGNATKNKKGYWLGNFKIPSDDDFNMKMTAPTDSYLANDYGLHHFSGNVAEYTLTDNVVKGGSWYDDLDAMKIDYVHDDYNSITEGSPFIGFRPVLVVSRKEVN